MDSLPRFAYSIPEQNNEVSYSSQVARSYSDSKLADRESSHLSGRKVEDITKQQVSIPVLKYIYPDMHTRAEEIQSPRFKMRDKLKEAGRELEYSTKQQVSISMMKYTYPDMHTRAEEIQSPRFKMREELKEDSVSMISDNKSKEELDDGRPIDVGHVEVPNVVFKQHRGMERVLEEGAGYVKVSRTLMPGNVNRSKQVARYPLPEGDTVRRNAHYWT